MKKLTKLLNIIISIIITNFSLSQYCNTVTSNDVITPSTSIQYTSTYSSGRRAFTFNAVAGNEYTFSTVGQTSVDTYLRLYNTSTGGTVLAESDDYNNTQSEITWYCPTSGSYSVLLTRWSSTTTCSALNANAKMKYQMGSISGSTIVSIGGGEVSDYNAPVNHYYKYGWTDMIYLQSEINSVGNITKIRFQVDPVTSIPYTATNQKIYMGHTTSSIFPSTVKEDAQTNYVSSDYTLVYNGTVNWAVGWVEIVLQTPFPWNNTNNLLIKWENRNNNWSSDEPYFYYTSKTNTVAYKVLDASYPTADGVRGSLRPNIKLVISNSVPLPIELLSFRGTTDNVKNYLYWSTASETDNHYFTVEKSTDGIIYKMLKVVMGAGNSTQLINYSYIDDTPENVINYYRLKQTDVNGNSSYSNIISINNSPTKKVVNYINTLGQEVSPDTGGLIFEMYDDGSFKKIIK